MDVFAEYFWLWTNEKDDLTEYFIFQNNLILSSEKATWENFENHTQMLESYQEFLKYALKDIQQ